MARNVLHRWWLALCLTAVTLGTQEPANAQPLSGNIEPVPKLLPLSLIAAPLLGNDAPTQNGWFGYLVQVTNPTGRPFEGTLYMTENPDPWVMVKPSLGTALVRTTFLIEPGQTATFELPAHGYRAHQVEIVAVDAEGRRLGETTATHRATGEALLLDLSAPSRIANALNGRGLVLAPAGPGSTTQLLAAASAQLDGKSGDLLLPTHAAAYAGASLVLAESEVLTRINDRQLIALSGWVLSGGSIAVMLTRPEDFEADALRRFVGGVFSVTAPSERLLAAANTFEPSPHAAIGGTTLELKSVLVSEELSKVLRGYTGANLRASAWGAVASYGMGEVHLLGFNPNQEPFIGSTWSEYKLKSLMERAISKRAQVVSPFGLQDPGDWRSQQVRRSLDPNVGNHWVIVACALLLLVYAVIAGPVNFQRSARKGNPLSALVRLPIFSFGAFVLILGLGWISKGGRARARHLTLVEAGAGMPRASAVRYRAFYAPSADALAVNVTEQGNVLDIAELDNTATRALHVERDGSRLDGFAARPWETVMVREDGFINLGSGITLLEQGNDVQIKNQSGRDLAAVVIRRQDGNLYLHERIADQESVLASDGEPITSAMIPSGGVQPLYLYGFQNEVDRVAPGIGLALEAWGAMAEGQEWWPLGVPVLLGQWVGGEGTLKDSGYRVDSDRVLLRVVGFGGEL